MIARTLKSLALALLLVAPAHAASDGRYQFTGIVTEVGSEKFSVQKNEKETWTFSLGSQTAPKVGDKVTVYYTMTAVEIEAKAAKKGKKGK
jgi:hypothetical protein